MLDLPGESRWVLPWFVSEQVGEGFVKVCLVPTALFCVTSVCVFELGISMSVPTLLLWVKVSLISDQSVGI